MVTEQASQSGRDGKGGAGNGRGQSKRDGKVGDWKKKRTLSVGDVQEYG